MSKQTNVEITIDEGTYLLVAEILRDERSTPELSMDDVALVIFAALSRMRPTEATS